VVPAGRAVFGVVGQVLGLAGGLLRLVGGLLCAFGPDPGLLSQAAGLLGLLLRRGLRLGGSRVLGHAVERVRGAGVLVLRRVPGDAVRLASLGHTLAGGDLPGLVLSHDHFFPASLPRLLAMVNGRD
jgi:hypothetical protein